MPLYRVEAVCIGTCRKYTAFRHIPGFNAEAAWHSFRAYMSYEDPEVVFVEKVSIDKCVGPQKREKEVVCVDSGWAE